MAERKSLPRSTVWREWRVVERRVSTVVSERLSTLTKWSYPFDLAQVYDSDQQQQTENGGNQHGRSVWRVPSLAPSSS